MTVSIEKPQIIPHITKSLTWTPYDVKWIPCSAKFVVLGQHARGTGAMQVYELDPSGGVELVHETEKSSAFKCSTFGASSLQSRHLATGDFDGRLSVWDLERTELPLYSVKAHDSLIHCIDGAGGVGVQSGPPEIVTGSKDGTVKIWDTRQKEKPVAKISPAAGEATDRDTWAVAFGNSYNDAERVVCAGYDNGDVKMFDLRNMSLMWETNVKNGVCGIEFDRKDIKMNKLVVTSLEGNMNVFDMRTMDKNKEFACRNHKIKDATTIWTVRHLPQNRDIFMTSSGTGSLCLYKYHYPTQRVKEDKEGNKEGVAGTVEEIQHATMAEQPVSAFDWSPDKQGLCVFSAFDQTVRVGIVTKLNLY